VLDTILNTVKGISPFVSDIVSITLKSTSSCNICHCSNTEEDCTNMLSLPVNRSVSVSLAERLRSVASVCPICFSNNSSTRDTQIVFSGSYVIFQLERFSYVEGRPIRNPTIVDCSEELVIPLYPRSLDDSMVVSFHNS